MSHVLHMNAHLAAALLLTLALAACGPGGLQAGGEYSGQPDTVIGNTERNMATGAVTSEGSIYVRRQGYMTTPAERLRY
ncbi:hypothetical protein JMJ55_11540 [Belnapia sp. T6]|uniref:Uncharacterized protein n=1 Tax=Belnapia mucosa TaxID=2804532 RepID=A0ABS1V5H5_9PROT|nr:hypothetical protein [Belnapia mucosa]MBL6455959.1 hypothetical protein [Belnapia mucosa]